MKLPKFLRKKFKTINVEEPVTEKTTKIHSLEVIEIYDHFIYTDTTGFGLGVSLVADNKVTQIRQFTKYPRNRNESLLIAQFPITSIITNIERREAKYSIIVKKKIKVLND